MMNPDPISRIQDLDDLKEYDFITGAADTMPVLDLESSGNELKSLYS